MREMVFTDIEIKVGDEVIFNHHYHGGLDWEEEDVYALDFSFNWEELGITSEVVSVPSPYRDNSVKHVLTCLNVQQAVKLAVEIMVDFERMMPCDCNREPGEQFINGFVDQFGNEVDADKAKQSVKIWQSGEIFKC